MSYLCNRLTTIGFILLVVWGLPSLALGQLRIVSYNTLDKPTTSFDDVQFNSIFSAIAGTARNGIAKRVDIVALQEQTRRLIGGQIVDTSQNIAARLNALHGVSTYEANLIGAGVDRTAIVYDTATVELISAQSVDIRGTRPAQLARFRPVGYDSPDADLYLYNLHLNASSSTTRASEISGLLNHAEGVVTSLTNAGSAANVIFTGDMNFGSSFETGYQNLTGNNANGATDPLSLSSWPNASVAEHMTQSTRTSNLADGGASGGMDDRFDLQLVTGDLLDAEGVTYLGPTSAGLSNLEHSYHAFGNDGVSWNTRINNTTAGRSQSATVINALHNFSDHLPVIADYQLPAVLETILATVPATLALGELFDLELTIRNAANVLTADGADELDYLVTTTGDATGMFTGTELALGSGETLAIPLDTSSLGTKSGLLRITTSSLAAANSVVEIPISYQVISDTLLGDFNDNGTVDAADYTLWRDGLETGAFLAADYDVWRTNFGATNASLSSTQSTTAVPEPSAHWLVLFLVLARLLSMRSRCVIPCLA